MWPSTRNGPLGRTVIFTASSDIVDTLSLAKDVLRIAKFTLFLSRSSNPLRQSPPTRSLATLKDCHPERTTMSKHSRQLSSLPVPLAKKLRTRSHHVDFHLIHIAPAPTLARLYRTHNRVLSRMKMLCRVPMKRRVAAPHMPTLQAHPQMHPVTVNLQTILATLRRRLHLPYLVHVSTLHSDHLPSPLILTFTARRRTPINAVPLHIAGATSVVP